MASLVSIGQGYKQQATQLMQGLAQQEQERNMANMQIKQQERQGAISNAATGATLGFMAGGPVGAIAGGIIGLGASLL